MLMTCTCHYIDLGSVSDCFEANFPWGTTNKSHYPDHYGFSAVIFQTLHRKLVMSLQNVGYFIRLYFPKSFLHALDASA